MNANTYKVTKHSNVRRHLSTLIITLAQLKHLIGKRLENVGHLFYHLTIYNRRPWMITFGVEDSEADGVVRHSVFDETHGVYRTYEKNFFIHNRWLARRCTNELIWQIKTCAAVGVPGRVLDIGWGRYSHSRDTRRPFDLTQLPSEEEIRARNERRLKVQRWFEKHFPAKIQDKKDLQRETARAILFR